MSSTNAVSPPAVSSPSKVIVFLPAVTNIPVSGVIYVTFLN
jgi:hypothetical protein